MERSPGDQGNCGPWWDPCTCKLPLILFLIHGGLSGLSKMGLMSVPGEQISVLQETLPQLSLVSQTEAEDSETQKSLRKSSWKGEKSCTTVIPTRNVGSAWLISWPQLPELQAAPNSTREEGHLLEQGSTTHPRSLISILDAGLLRAIFSGRSHG